MFERSLNLKELALEDLALEDLTKEHPAAEKPTRLDATAAGKRCDLHQTTLDGLRSFIFERFPIARDRGLADDASLLESGAVDSLGILDIVLHLEERYDFIVSDDELQPSYFDSIQALAQFVGERQR